MNDAQNHPNENMPPVSQGFPTDSPVAPPSDFFPPQAPVQHSKKLSSGKIVATVFGLLVLAGGLGAGVILVQQPQQTESLAYIVPAPANVCPSGLMCQAGRFSFGSNRSISCSVPIYQNSNGVNVVVRYDPYNCCSNPGDMIYNNKCVTSCPGDRSNCDTYIRGGTKCTVGSTGAQLYCCRAGTVHTNAGCEVPLAAGNSCTYAPLGVNTRYNLVLNSNGCMCHIKYTCTSSNVWQSDGQCRSFVETSQQCVSDCFTNGVYDPSKPTCP